MRGSCRLGGQVTVIVVGIGEEGETADTGPVEGEENTEIGHSGGDGVDCPFGGSYDSGLR